MNFVKYHYLRIFLKHYATFSTEKQIFLDIAGTEKLGFANFY